MSQAPSIPRNGLAERPVSDRAQRIGGALLIVFAWYFLTFTDIHRMLAHYIGGDAILKRIPLLFFVLMPLVLVQRRATTLIYWPLVLFTGAHFVSILGADNRGLAFNGFKSMVFFLIALTAALTVIRTPLQALTFYRIFLLSFPWYFVQGIPAGLVRWHHELGNPDAFGPLGVMGMGLGYFFAMGTSVRSWRYLGFGISALGALACVASFARGAFVAGVVAAAVIWLRSPRKMATLAAGIAGLVLAAGAAEVVHPGGAFWAEMATITAEGKDEGTGRARWEHWTKVAWPVFLTSPIVGVGAHCTGVVGARIIRPGEISGRWKNPERLYNFPLHSVYVQILAEQGILGSLLWIWMTLDFFRRLRMMRANSSRDTWAKATGGRVDLQYLALGLEAAMAGFLVGAVFYNQTYRHWYFSLLLFAVMLSEMSRLPASRSPKAADSPRDR